MRGGHCIKTWSKTQALIAKSSGEAELYAVVRGATEALGMATLAKDMGRKVEIQLHIDALAAKGMIERKGLSKVRHLDVNVLWLQEQCARKLLPVAKVPGEDNPADLMTKHLVAPKVVKNTATMNMRRAEGRAGKAAQLHLVSRDGHNGVADCNGQQYWDAMDDRYSDRHGGDYWKSRGEDGVWHRIHAKPRRSLFTPYKVAKGPESRERLKGTRFTQGVTRSGKVFEFHDGWQNPDNAHRLLDEHWVGCTTFIAEGKVTLSDMQQFRASPVEKGNAGAKLRWSDILE